MDFQFRNESSYFISLYSLLKKLIPHSANLGPHTINKILGSFYSGIFVKQWAAFLNFNSESQSEIAVLCLESFLSGLYHLPVHFIFPYASRLLQDHNLLKLPFDNLLNLRFFLALAHRPLLINNLQKNHLENLFSILLLFIDEKKFSYPQVISIYQIIFRLFIAAPFEEKVRLWTRISSSLTSQLGKAVLDVLSRYIHNDKDHSLLSLKKSEGVGLISSKSFLVDGNSVLTINSLKTGWAHLIWRRISGFSCWFVQQEAIPIPLIEKY